MVWVRLDDGFFRHPKVMRAGKDARDLYLVGLTYSSANLTDGFIPSQALAMLGAEAMIDNPAECAERLTQFGLWEAVEDGYKIHDYLEYQPSSQKVREERAENAARQADWRAKRQAARNTVTNSVTNTPRNAPVTAATLTSSSPVRPGNETHPELPGGGSAEPAAIAAPLDVPSSIDLEPPRPLPRAVPKPIRKPTKYGDFLDAVKKQSQDRAVDVLIRGSADRNAKAVNESPYSVEQLAAAVLAYETGEWQDPFIAKQGHVVFAIAAAAGAWLERGKFNGHAERSRPTKPGVRHS